MKRINPVGKSTVAQPKQYFLTPPLFVLRKRHCVFFLLIITQLFLYPTLVQAENITVGRGSGVLWKGLGFSQFLHAINSSSTLHPTGGIAVISNMTTGCIPESQLTLINGIYAYPIAPGIGLVPDATPSGYFIGSDLELKNLTGSIGLNGTQGTFAGAGNAVIPTGKQWCLTIEIPDFQDSSVQNITIRGAWAIIADGTQASGDYTLPIMYAGTFTANDSATGVILAADNSLRVNTLECTVDTTSNVNFGNVLRDTTTDAELAVLSYPLTVYCDQTPGTISSNIKIAFAYRTALYNGEAAKLAVNPSGAYITGEISDDITGAGICGQNTGVLFNNTPIDIGNVDASDTNTLFSHLVTWRLCSGGSLLPSGPITASAELEVTFN